MNSSPPLLSGPCYPFADLDLARRLERAEGHASSRFVQARMRIEPDTGAACAELAGAYVMFDGPESPLTQTFALGLSGAVLPEQLDEIETFFSGRGATIFHEVCPLAESTLVAMLYARRYEPFEFTSVMYRPLDKGAAPEPIVAPGVTVRIAAGGDRERWAQTAAAGWEETPEVGPFMLKFARIIAASDDGWPFLGELDGQMVATGSLILNEGVALLAGASTVVAGRRRGVQNALLAARLRHAADLGCDLAMMAAQPGSSSQRNAERNGFRIAYTRIKWRKPGELSEPA